MVFQEAFHVVTHHKFLYKIKQLGIMGALHKWFAMWLSNRQQRVLPQSGHQSLEVFLKAQLLAEYVHKLHQWIRCWTQ